MKQGRIAGLSGLLALGLAASFPGGADAANTCVRSCATAKRACVKEAREMKLDCKGFCRDTVAPTELGECVRTCMETFREAKTACRAIFLGCKENCGGPAPTTTSTVPSPTTTVPSTTTSTLPGSPNPAFLH